MNIVLAPLLWKGVLVFIDDILIHSADEDAHLRLLRQVFQLLKDHNLKIKRNKCSFARPKLMYLGHEISGDGVRTDQKNIATVQNWPVPTNVKGVRGFLGLAGYYRKFVHGLAVTCWPLTDLLKKGVIFRSTELEEGAFRALQEALIVPRVLPRDGSMTNSWTKKYTFRTKKSKKNDKTVGTILYV